MEGGGATSITSPITATQEASHGQLLRPTNGNIAIPSAFCFTLNVPFH